MFFCLFFLFYFIIYIFFAWKLKPQNRRTLFVGVRGKLQNGYKSDSHTHRQGRVWHRTVFAAVCFVPLVSQ